MGNIRLIAFDLDGVLLDTTSSWVTVHKHFGTDNEAGLEIFLKGEIDDHEFMEWDVKLWTRNGDVHISEIDTILSEVKLIKGAKETLEQIHEMGIETAIISGGIDLVANKTGERLGIKRVHANGLETNQDGNLTGRGIMRVPLLDKASVI